VGNTGWPDLEVPGWQGTRGGQTWKFCAAQEHRALTTASSLGRRRARASEPQVPLPGYKSSPAKFPPTYVPR
jgi:hypothetical protein